MVDTVSDHLVAILDEWGVDTVFGLPGDGINGLVEAFRKAQDRIRYIHCRHEETAALAACAYAKFTGRLGVIFSTAAPGAVHLLNGLYDAKIDGAPVLAITGMTCHDLIGTHYLQDINQDVLFQDVAAYNQRLMGPEHVEILTYDGLRLRVDATDDETLALIRTGGGRRAEIYSRLKDLAARYGDEIRRRYPDIPRRVSGYNLDDLLPEKGFHIARALVGSEGTCALVLAATVRLLPWPAERALLVLGYPNIAQAADDVGELRGFEPIGLEAFDGHVLDNMKRKGRWPAGATLLPQGRAWLLAKFGGDDQREANDEAERAFARLNRLGTHASGMRLIKSAEEQAQIWHIRESSIGASHIPGEEVTWPSWEDATVPPYRLGDYLRDFNKLNGRFGYTATIFGHFGDGCVHPRMNFGLKTAEGIARFRRYMQEASDLCLNYGGSLSGEHGDGQAKGELLPKMFGPRLIQAFRESGVAATNCSSRFRRCSITAGRRSSICGSVVGVPQRRQACDAATNRELTANIAAGACGHGPSIRGTVRTKISANRAGVISAARGTFGPEKKNLSSPAIGS